MLRNIVGHNKKPIDEETKCPDREIRQNLAKPTLHKRMTSLCEGCAHTQET